MKSLALAFAALPLLAAAPVDPKPALAPSEIVAAAPSADWVRIAPTDLLVMDLAPDGKGRARRIIIQLMPPPFSKGWVSNIRTLVAARWYDGVSVNRVQDNYVAQWGDAEGEDPKKAKPLPSGLTQVPQSAYVLRSPETVKALSEAFRQSKIAFAADALTQAITAEPGTLQSNRRNPAGNPDPYSMMSGFVAGWPIGADLQDVWPVHCYGMVGVGRGLSPDTGTGAELYTVIGHAPRHLDRNIALVGRVIEGIEHLSSLPRGTEALGFYKTAEERTSILSVRMGNEVKGLPPFEYLSTESRSFMRYADARANRRDAFFNVPAGGADICNVPVPVRRAKG